MQEAPIQPHPWKARFVVGLLMIIISIGGLIISSLWKSGAWNYWRVTAPIYAVLCIWLSYYLRKNNQSSSLGKIWHEIIHWIAFILTLFLFSMFVEIGIMGRFEASLGILTLLALTIFLAGVYVEPSLMVIGILMGFFAFGAAFLGAYLYSIMLPVALVFIGILFVVLYIGHKKKNAP